MIEKRDLIAIRPYTPADYNFILATWLRGLYYGDSWFSLIPKDVFMKHYHNVIESLLSLPTTKVKIACLRDDPEVILGYVVVNQDDTVLHFCFIKKAWRAIGIARSLVSPSTKTVTHLTKLGQILLRKKPEIVFNPFTIGE